MLRPAAMFAVSAFLPMTKKPQNFLSPPTEVFQSELYDTKLVKHRYQICTQIDFALEAKVNNYIKSQKALEA